MNNKIIIAIDGYSSCGKSTFAKMLAAKLGYLFVDSGAMYRAITLYAMRHGLLTDRDALVAALPSVEIGFIFNPEKKKSDIYLGSECVEDEIRTLAVSNNVSSISTIVQVRELLCHLQQQMGKEKGIVMDGRDIGTTVFPQAELKIFMTASVEVRAMRRYKELLAKGEEVSLEEISKNISERDYQDQTRQESPLRRADDAILLDNSDMSVEQQMCFIEDILKEKIGC